MAKSANNTKTWTRWSARTLFNYRAERPLLEGDNLLWACSPGARFVASVSTAWPEQWNAEQDAADLSWIRVHAMEDGQGRLHLETRLASARKSFHPTTQDQTMALAVADDGTVALQIANQTGGPRVEVHDASGLRFRLSGHVRPGFTPGGTLLTQHDGALVRSDARTGQELRRDSFPGGEVLGLASEDVFYSYFESWGWVTRDGVVTQGAERMTSVRPAGAGAVLLGHRDEADQVRYALRSPGGEARPVVLPSANDGASHSLFAASADGTHLAITRMPSRDEAAVRGLSQAAARTLSVRALATPEHAVRELAALWHRGGYTGAGIDSGKLLAWPTPDRMLLIRELKLLQYNPLADALTGGGPLETRCLAPAGARYVTSHDDGVRSVEPGKAPRFHPLAGARRLAPSPDGSLVAVEHAQGWSILATESLEPWRTLESWHQVVWADDGRVVARKPGTAVLLDVRSGHEEPLPLKDCLGVFAAPSGFLVAWPKKLERRDSRGEVTTTWPLGGKLKALSANSLQDIRLQGDTPWVSHGGLLYRESEGSFIEALAKLYGMLSDKKRCPCRFEQFALRETLVAVATGSEAKARWKGVVVVDATDETVKGWSGPLPSAWATDPHVAGLCWDGDGLVVGEVSGLVHRFELPT